MIRLASAKVFILTLWMHSVFRIEKKFSAKALSYGLPRLDMDGIIPYCCSAYHCVLTRYALCGSHRCYGTRIGTLLSSQPEADPLPVCPCDCHNNTPYVVLLFSYIGGLLSIVRFYWFGSTAVQSLFHIHFSGVMRISPPYSAYPECWCRSPR